MPNYLELFEVSSDNLRAQQREPTRHAPVRANSEPQHFPEASVHSNGFIRLDHCWGELYPQIDTATVRLERDGPVPKRLRKLDVHDL